MEKVGRLMRSVSRGQSFVEYAVLVMAIAVALACIGVYVQRGVAGHLRTTARKLTSEVIYPYDKLRLRPEIYSQEGLTGLHEEDILFGAAKVPFRVRPGILFQEGSAGIAKKEVDAGAAQAIGLGANFSYSHGGTTGSSQRQTQISEYAQSQGKTVTTANSTNKMTSRMETISN